MPRTRPSLEEIASLVSNVGDFVRDPLLILDPDLRVLSANSAFYEMFGTTVEETEKKRLSELGSGQWKISERDGFEFSHDFPEVGPRVLRVHSRTLSLASIPTELIALSLVDTTVQKQSPETVVISETRYRRLFEAARDGILILDSDYGKVTDANPFMTELLGYTHEELLGKELWEIGLLKDEEASREAFQQLKEQGSIRYDDLPLESQEAEKREVEFVSNLYQEGDKTVIQCNIRDITARKLLEGELAADSLQDKKIASILQRTMLFQPKEDAFSGLSVQTIYSTASDEALVGGDFWDTFAFDHGHVALVCGDVMGHGLSSAVFTTELKHTLRAYIREHEQPSRIMQQMNEFLLQSNRLFLEGINTEGDDAPVCLALAILDRKTGEGSLAVAGIPWPLLIRANGEVEMLKASGRPLGINIEPKAFYRQINFQLA